MIRRHLFHVLHNSKVKSAEQVILRCAVPEPLFEAVERQRLEVCEKFVRDELRPECQQRQVLEAPDADAAQDEPAGAGEAAPVLQSDEEWVVVTGVRVASVRAGSWKHVWVMI